MSAGLDRIPGVVGYLILNEDGAVVAVSDGYALISFPMWRLSSSFLLLNLNGCSPTVSCGTTNPFRTP